MRTIIIAVLTAAGALSILGQERVITAAEFDAIEHAADAPFKNKQAPVRWTITTESRLRGRPQTDYVNRSVIEFGASGTSRVVSESSFGGGQIKKVLSIKAGGRTYTKVGDGVWKQNVESARPMLEREDLNADTATPDVIYKYLGDEVVSGEKIHTYLRTETSERVSNKTGAVSRSEVSTKYWLGESGDFYRSEYRHTDRTGDNVLQTTIIIEKKFDPSISISAPTL